jgi:hypothetical protein
MLLLWPSWVSSVSGKRDFSVHTSVEPSLNDFPFVPSPARWLQLMKALQNDKIIEGSAFLSGFW